MKIFPPLSPSKLIAGTLALCAGAAAAALVSSCSAPQGSSLARVFFDVPEGESGVPRKPDRSVTPWYRKSRAGRIQFAAEHPPFRARQCAACHDQGSTRQPLQDSLSMCGACHADIFEPKAVFHGPVAVGACGFCHEPHLSPRADLLRDGDPALCLACHEGTGFAHCPGRQIGMTRGCLPCHEPHSADAEFLLRPREQWRDLLSEPSAPGD